MDTTTAPPIHPPRQRTRAGRVRSALRSLLRPRVALVAALGAAGFGMGFLGTWPPFATVMSASMEPAVDTGDVVVMKRLDRAPRPGDIIAVSVPDEARARFGYPPTVVHRVVRVGDDGRITTKGDARERIDPFTVPRSAVRSRVVATVPAAGRAFAFLTSPMGLLWLAAGVVLLIGLPVVERQRDARRAEEETLAGLRSDLRRVHDELALLRAEAAAGEAPDPPPAAVRTVRRRRGGLVGALARRLR